MVNSTGCSCCRSAECPHVHKSIQLCLYCIIAQQSTYSLGLHLLIPSITRSPYKQGEVCSVKLTQRAALCWAVLWQNCRRLGCSRRRIGVRICWVVWCGLRLSKAFPQRRPLPANHLRLWCCKSKFLYSAVAQSNSLIPPLEWECPLCILCAYKLERCMVMFTCMHDGSPSGMSEVCGWWSCYWGAGRGSKYTGRHVSWFVR